MAFDEEKQAARKRRERKLRGWLTLLSWGTPVIAFSCFFGIWHHLGSTAYALTPPSSPTVTATQQKASANSPILKIGSHSPQVRIIQTELAQLGYFNQPSTNDYGHVAADAIKSFQAANQLPQTGMLDDQTYLSLQQAVKENSAANLTQTNAASAAPTQTPNQGSASLSQQNSPVAVSSAS